MEKVKEIKWIGSFGITALFFLIINWLLYPLFNSGDDVFLMYSLAGGYGEAPTNLLHYQYGWHPVLGWMVKSLFVINGFINWYSLALLIFQVIACTIILHVLLNKFRLLTGLFLFFAFFFFFEIRIFLSLNYTASSWLLATASMILLLYRLQGGVKAKWISVVIPGFLWLLAGLLRFHCAVAVLLLFVPAFFIFAGPGMKKWIITLSISVIILLLLNWQQHQYYASHITGWKEQEKIRQSLFYAYNRPNRPLENLFANSTERAFYENQFFYDTSYISAQRINEISRTLVTIRDFRQPEDAQALYWFWMEMRIFILLYAMCFLILWRQRLLLQVLKRWLPGALAIILTYALLFFALKITEAIHMGLQVVLWIYFILSLPPGLTVYLKKKDLVFIIFLIVPFCWMGARIYKINEENKKKHERFECVIPELRRHADNIFIATDDRIPLDFFYIWDPPSRYSVKNLIYRDRMLTGAYQFTLQRYHISDLMNGIYQNQNVFLVGGQFPALKQYYLGRYRKKVEISAPLEGFQCIEVRRVIVTSDSLTGHPGSR